MTIPMILWSWESLTKVTNTENEKTFLKESVIAVIVCCLFNSGVRLGCHLPPPPPIPFNLWWNSWKAGLSELILIPMFIKSDCECVAGCSNSNEWVSQLVPPVSPFLVDVSDMLKRNLLQLIFWNFFFKVFFFFYCGHCVGPFLAYVFDLLKRWTCCS